MTIIYQYRVATTSLGGFLRLLRAWKGSVYKLLYKELIIFLSLYALISLVYRLALTKDQRKSFEGIVLELYAVSTAIPLSFVLGFYVAFIVQRWWQQFTNVPWPDRTLFIMCTYLHGTDDKARMMRRSVARYMLFGFIIICRAVSVAVMKRFPTIDHIVEAGFITKEEANLYETTQCKYLKFWVPLMWANNVLITARREGKIQTDFGLRMIIEQLADFRDKCSLCFVYDWITVPLVYTQVVTFAVHSYFAVCLFGQQYLDPLQNYDGFGKDLYIPGFTILQFLFYMGWLKVAEQMINPFGEDDDDYDINWLLDRHTAVAFALVDQCYGKHPELTRDQFWNDVAPDVPYTESSIGSIRPNFLGSTFNIARQSIDTDRLIMRDNEFPINQDWPTRPRGKGSMTGSLLSLFPFRHLRHHGNTDSQTTLASNGSGHGRFMSVPNGKLPQYQAVKRISDELDEDRRSSVGLPPRERANTDLEFRAAEERERKLSLPFTINLFSKNKQKNVDAQPSSSPKLSRFSVRPVIEETLSDSDTTQSAKTRRTGHTAINFQNSDRVSRIPVLSAIEEGNTVTSIRQLLHPGEYKNGNSSGDEMSISDLNDDVSLEVIRENKTEGSSAPQPAQNSNNDSELEPLLNVDVINSDTSVQLQLSSPLSTTTEGVQVDIQEGVNGDTRESTRDGVHEGAKKENKPEANSSMKTLPQFTIEEF